MNIMLYYDDTGLQKKQYRQPCDMHKLQTRDDIQPTPLGLDPILLPFKFEVIVRYGNNEEVFSLSNHSGYLLNGFDKSFYESLNDEFMRNRFHLDYDFSAGLTMGGEPIMVSYVDNVNLTIDEYALIAEHGPKVWADLPLSEIDFTEEFISNYTSQYNPGNFVFTQYLPCGATKSRVTNKEHEAFHWADHSRYPYEVNSPMATSMELLLRDAVDVVNFKWISRDLRTMTGESISVLTMKSEIQSEMRKMLDEVGAKLVRGYWRYDRPFGQKCQFDLYDGCTNECWEITNITERMDFKRKLIRQDPLQVSRDYLEIWEA